MALVRMQYSAQTTQKDRLLWAYPLDSSISEYPLINEIVIIMRYENKCFYTRRVNIKNFPNEAVDFSINKTISGQENTEYNSKNLYSGNISKTNYNGFSGNSGIAGKYYKINNNVRRIRRYEGDLIIESRFGQSIRFGAYSTIKEDDTGSSYSEYNDYGGNPMIIIRNRQRKLLKPNEELKLINSPNLDTIKGTEEEKNAGGYIEENINHDGSSIYITSGKTESTWKTTCYKTMFGIETVSGFTGNTKFVYPKLLGDQIVINTDRLILSSRNNETFHYSKKRYGIVTDDEYTLDAHNQIVLTTHNKAVINSPAIYLGQYDVTDEPVLLGQTTVNWLYDLCNWLINHIHKHEHGHIDAGEPSPRTTQTPVDPQIRKLEEMRDSLKKLMSKRVFVTGGGFAPGQNGASIPGGETPVNINVATETGVPGGWKGVNKR
jgi:hypothetical protein